jgi:hypothetical protein
VFEFPVIKANTEPKTHAMPFNPMQLAQLIIIMPFLYLISNDIISNIFKLHCKAESNTWNHTTTCITMIYCVTTIARTWLKTLIIACERDTVVHLYNKEEPTTKEEQTTPKEE